MSQGIPITGVSRRKSFHRVGGAGAHKDRNHETFWCDYNAIYMACKHASENPSWTIPQIVWEVGYSCGHFINNSWANSETACLLDICLSFCFAAGACAKKFWLKQTMFQVKFKTNVSRFVFLTDKPWGIYAHPAQTILPLKNTSQEFQILTWNLVGHSAMKQVAFWNSVHISALNCQF